MKEILLKPYAESDHILTLVYNLLSGGETLNDVNRLGDDPAIHHGYTGARYLESKVD